jgi:hypothetical protein
MSRNEADPKIIIKGVQAFVYHVAEIDDGM